MNKGIDTTAQAHLFCNGMKCAISLFLYVVYKACQKIQFSTFSFSKQRNVSYVRRENHHLMRKKTNNTINTGDHEGV